MPPESSVRPLWLAVLQQAPVTRAVSWQVGWEGEGGGGGGGGCTALHQEARHTSHPTGVTPDSP